MPNWCDCSLTVSGDKKQIAELKKKAPKKEAKKDSKGKVIKHDDGEIDYWKTDFSLANFIPIPKELERTSPFRAENGETEEEAKEIQKKLKKKYKADTWWDWCVYQGWGTKWDIKAKLIDDSPTRLSYDFQSAWSPPIDGITTISSMFPKLKFRLEYEETGMGYTGYAKFQDGVSVDSCEDIEYNKEHVCAECGENSIRTNTDKAGECEYCGGDNTEVVPAIKCPLCEEEIPYKNFNGVHYWSCPACMFVGVEYYNNKNLDELKKALK